MEELRTPQEGPDGRIWLLKNGNYQLIEDKTMCRGTATVNSIQIHSAELHSDDRWHLLLCLSRMNEFGTELGTFARMIFRKRSQLPTYAKKQCLPGPTTSCPH